MQGYIKLHRKILDNPIVCKDAEHFIVWCYLLLNATHKEVPALFGGKKISLKPGQLITGRKAISQKTGVEESKIKRILKLFENDQQIDRQTTNQNTLISILRWDDYQKSDQQNDQRVTNGCPTSDQRVTTNKNVKNVNNDKNVNNSSSFSFKGGEEKRTDKYGEPLLDWEAEKTDFEDDEFQAYLGEMRRRMRERGMT